MSHPRSIRVSFGHARRLIGAGVALALVMAMGGQNASAAINEWTWVGGSDTVEQPGVYGVQGQPHPDNHPGARYGATTSKDQWGNVWLFGGNGKGYPPPYLFFNDLWRWDGTNWTWVSGSDGANQLGVYGTKGQPHADNHPGARTGAVSGVDSQGNLWIFGGYGYATTSTLNYLNDLWKWDGVNWTWVSGSDSPREMGVYGTMGQPRPENHPGARDGMASWVDTDGNLWLFGGVGALPNSDNIHFNDLWKWDGVNWTWVSGSDDADQEGVYGTMGQPRPENHPGARYYAMSWMGADGTLWLFGGRTFLGSGPNNYGDLWKWDGTNWTWVSGPNTYGQDDIFDAQGQPIPANHPGSRLGGIAWVDHSGNLWLFGGTGWVPGGEYTLNDLWKYDGVTWTWFGGSTDTFQPAVYGELGTPAPGSHPGARDMAVSWVDESGDLRLFGGYGHDGHGSESTLNDLWKFEVLYTYTLTVVGSGGGSGTMSDGGSISCAWDGSAASGACDNTAGEDTAYAITATADPGSVFTGWSGCDSTSGTNGEVCHITPDSDALVTASFAMSLSASMACDGSNLDVTISAGDGPFNITGGGPGLPRNGVSAGVTTLTPSAPGVWTDVTVTETAGDLESTHLGDISCGQAARAPSALSSPKDGAAVYTHTPKLSWKSQKNVLGYHVQIDDNDDFVTPLQESDPTAPKYTATSLDFGTYFWQVAIQDAGGWSEYSLPFSFDVTLNKTPKKNAATTDRTPKFTWLKVEDISSYALRAHTTEADCQNNAGVLDPVIDQDDLPSPSFTQPTDLDPGSYFWHVSIDGGNNWTPCWRFDITTLKSPKYGSATTSLTPTFSWLKNKYATHYHLQVSTDETFTAPSPIDDNTLTGTTYPAQLADDLDYGQYFWHVSEDVGGFGPFTPNGMFFITNMSAPKNNLFTLKGKVTFAWKKVADATGYTLTVSKNPDGVTDPVFAPPTTSALKATATLPRGIYYWRIETTGVVHVMPVWTFTIGP